jgi:hypothetical protein
VNKWKAATDPRETEKYLGGRPFGNFVFTEPAASWDDFLRWLNELQGSWGFRGQREAWWLLDTSLDLALKREFSFRDSSGYDTCGHHHLDREIAERESLFRFQQQAHQYIANPPSSDDLSSWLALMQHHGARTRLLDWTKSPHVAMYFAVEEEAQGEEKSSTVRAIVVDWLETRGRELLGSEVRAECLNGLLRLLREKEEKSSAVWAIDLDWLEARGRELLGSEVPVPASGDPQAKANYLNGLLRQPEKPVIVQINPVRIDDRMAAQQGFFLCKLTRQASFSLILMDMMLHPDIPDRPVLRKLVVKSDLRITFLKKLREMNIHSASLFPGLDGFGKSLTLDQEIKVKEGSGPWPLPS